ncbi:hypothetical protein RZS08_63510, partial [Arthrospira platensis SPKY1]|nr:hypothetical protein [Arthrospira platensis SPKY1]
HHLRQPAGARRPARPSVTLNPRRSAAAGGGPEARARSERDRHAEMQSQAAFLMPPGKVERERAGRAAPARTDAIAHAQVEIVARVGRITGIDEEGRAPLRL